MSAYRVTARVNAAGNDDEQLSESAPVIVAPTVLTLYQFKYCDPLRKKWLRTRYRLTEEEALQRFGAGNFERIEGSREDRIIRPPEEMRFP